MNNKPTYEELEQRVKDLEQEVNASKREEERLVMFQKFTEASGQGLGWSNIKGEIIYFNPALCRIAGEERLEDIVGKSLLRYYDKETRKRLAEDILPAVIREGQWVGELDLYNTKGEMIPTLNNIFVIRNEVGEPMCFSNVLSDISEKKLAEEQLLKLSSAVEQSSASIMITDVDGNIEYVNPKFTQITGYSPEEVVGKNPRFLNLGEHQPEYFRGLWDTICADKIWRGKFINKKKNGELYWESASISPVTNSEGVITHYVAVKEDITERKQTEDALRVSEKRFSDIINNTSSVIYLKDLEGRYLLINRQFENLFNVTKDESAGKTDHDIFPKDMADAFRENDKAVLKTGTPLELEEEALHDDGIHTYISVKFPLYNVEGNPYGVCGISTDITERKRAEEALQRVRDELEQKVEKRTAKLNESNVILRNEIVERKQAEEEKHKLQSQLFQAQKMEYVGRLAGGIAHDFNNIMTAILGYAQFALDKIDNNTALRKDIESIYNSGKKAANLTRQLLTFSREQMVQPQTLNMNTLVDEAWNMLNKLIKNDIEIKIIHGEGLLNIKADPVQIEQIIMNLTTNARDAMPQGGTLTFETARTCLDEENPKGQFTVQSGEYVMLTVSDTGCGISQDIIEHIFEPFFTTKKVGEGTGLGLATVYGIIQQNNGNIEVYSEPEMGTTVKIYIPCYGK